MAGGNPFYQNLDPGSAPDPVTPADSPSSPLFSAVTPHGEGPAPYNIQAPGDEGAVTAVFNGANQVAGAGTLYPMGPRQAQARHLLESPQGFSSGGGTSGWDITAGWSGEPDESWPNNPQP